MLSTGLVETEQLIFIGLVSTVVIAVTKISGLDAYIRVWTANLDSTTVDWKSGTGLLGLVGYSRVVAVVVSITDLGLIDTMPVSTGKHSDSTAGSLSTVEFV